jgi:hypothetical protein
MIGGKPDKEGQGRVHHRAAAFPRSRKHGPRASFCCYIVGEILSKATLPFLISRKNAEINPKPIGEHGYPKKGHLSVWNVRALCSFRVNVSLPQIFFTVMYRRREADPSLSIDFAV